ncbi:MAG TPA: hypothetical protein VFT74_17920 [Isosphaeraceae bacterium]|nr:hypothetical protein [Isosphaeraceae bacterium]
MSENWKFQASPKIGDLLCNIRGEDAQEFEANLLDFPVGAVAQLIANINGAEGLAAIVQPSTRNRPAPAGSGEQAQESQAATQAPARQRGSSNGSSSYGRRKSQAGTGGRGGQKPKLTYEEASADCVHGERVRRSGNGARGEWVGYFCPAPKGSADQCPPNFLDPSDDQEG